MFVAINGTDPLFPIDGAPPFDIRDLAGAVVVGIVAAVGARAFAGCCAAKPRSSRRSAATPQHGRGRRGHRRAASCSARLVTGESLLVGSGYDVLAWVAEPGRSSAWVVLALLVLRCLATSATVAGGGVGGLFIPLVVAGALTGVARSARRQPRATSTCSSSSASPPSSAPATGSRWPP